MPTLKRAAITRPYQQALSAALAVVVLLGLAFVGLELRLEFDRARALRAEVERSHVARAQLLQIFSSMQDAETGQRGHVITGQASYLEPYNSAARALGAELPRLKALYRDNPEQAANLAWLETLIARKQAAMRVGILAHDTEGREAGLDAVSNGVGKAAMDDIRVAVDRMVAVDAQALADATRRADARSRMTERLVAGVFLLLIAVVALTGFLIWRYVRTRRVLLDAVQATVARQTAIFDSAIDAILTLNPSGSVETLNLAATRMFGWTAPELGRRDVSILMDLAGDGETAFLTRIGANREDFEHGVCVNSRPAAVTAPPSPWMWP